MKKILYVHHVSSIGGASFCLLNIIKGLDRSLYEPSVLLAKPGPLASKLEEQGISVYYMPSLTAIPYNKTLKSFRTIIGYLKVFKSRRKFKSFLEGRDFDIVYFNNMMLYPYLKVIGNKCKAIVHVREHWPLEEHKNQLRKAQNDVTKYANQIVTISKFSASMFPECAHKCTVVHDWISFDDRHKAFDFNELFGEDVSGKKIYLYTGGSHWTKGALEVVQTFTSHIKDRNSRLLILGINKKEKRNKSFKDKLKSSFLFRNTVDYQQNLLSLVSADNRIKTLPSIYEIADIMKDVYCNLSYFTIPHANLTLAECILVGTPSVAARTSESMEYSDEGKLSVLYDFKDIQAFEKAIDYLNNNYEIIKRQIEEGNCIIKEMFSPESNLLLLNTAYERCFTE